MNEMRVTPGGDPVDISDAAVVELIQERDERAQEQAMFAEAHRRAGRNPLGFVLAAEHAAATANVLRSMLAERTALRSGAAIVLPVELTREMWAAAGTAVVKTGIVSHDAIITAVWDALRASAPLVISVPA